ncbi:MAG: NAD-dependent epimerase/dehydratase family protein [Promethearchaeota archaeon]|jgi:nucleoside-diphosphate-sugar epimerase
MVTALITGGTGFIGTHLVKRLSGMGYKIRLLIRESSDISPFKQLKNIEYLYGDVRDIESLSIAAENIDLIYHLAAYTSMWAEDVSIYHDINVKGTENVANIALEKNILLFYVSSFTALGPTSLEPVDETHENENFCMDYEVSKFQARQVIKNFITKGLKIISFYPGIVYGPGDFNIFGKMLFDVMRGKIFPLGLCPGKGDSLACFSYIDDVIDGLVSVLERKDLIGEDFILGGENIELGEYLNLIAKISRNKKIRRIPMKAASMYAWMLETKAKITKKPPSLTRSTLNALRFHRVYSSEKAIKQIGYKITPLSEGLEKTIEWYKNYSES